MAFLTKAWVLADFSNWIAIRSMEISRLPDASPALAIWIKSSGNALGCFAMESAKLSPFSTSARTAMRDFCKSLFSVCSANIFRASMMLTPARTMLANCRQNTARSLAAGFLSKLMLISRVKVFCCFTSRTMSPCCFRSLVKASCVSASLLPLISFPVLSIAT